MKSIYNLLGCLGIVFSFSNCKRFVEVPSPVTQLVTTSVFSDAGSATAALLSIYTSMYTNMEPFNMSLASGLLSDELTNYSNSTTNLEFYTNSMAAVSNLGCWVTAYNYIYRSNSIIENLQNSQVIVPVIRNQLIGESKFIRAFWHFYLTNSYGDVPLVTTSNYASNSNIARTPRQEIYNQIISDLSDAQNLLNPNYVDADDTSLTAERIRPNKWAAAALLARVYLYTGKYDSAEMEATMVIGNSGLYSLDSNLNNVFLANSTEAIWQIAVPSPNPFGSNTAEGVNYILVADPTLATISPQLLSSFEPGDARMVNWISTFADTTISPEKIYYFPYKYKIQYSTTVTEYEMVLRLAEIFLIRAEARAMQNNTLGAATDLNVIRKRANLSNTNAITPSGLLAAILHERQVELFTEWGHRWFDLIRTGNVNAVMSVVTPKKEGSWSPNWQLYPIPQVDRKSDPNLTQNNGY